MLRGLSTEMCNPISNPDLFGWLVRSGNHISNLYSKWLSGHTLVSCQSMLIRQEEIFPNQVVLVPFFLKSPFLKESLSCNQRRETKPHLSLLGSLFS